jgi:hypothetical protein
MTGCGNRNKKNDDTIVEKDSIITEQQEVGTLTSDKNLQDIARFISEKRFKRVRHYTNLRNLLFGKDMPKKRISVGSIQKKAEIYRNLASAELYPNTKEIKTLFYPFSGADFFCMLTFFFRMLKSLSIRT